MQDIRTHWDAFIASKKPGEPLDPELHKRFYDKAKHSLQFFTFHPSTPSAAVSSEMLSAFFNCGVLEFPIVSNVGIKSALGVRMPDPMFSKFLPELPVFPEELLDDSKSVLVALQEKGMLRGITFTDVVEELRERPLSEEEMAACLQWWISRSQQNSAGVDDDRQALLGAAFVTVGSPDNGDKWGIPLRGIRTILNPDDVVVPTDGPLPDHLLPISVNQKLDSTQLQESLQWREFTILEWVQHIVDPAVYTRMSKFNIVESSLWAGRVLQVLGGCWATLPEDSRTSIVALLDNLACIPTSVGMKTPGEAYFPDADIFRDLPVVSLPSVVYIGTGLEGALADLGVRKHVDLQVIFDR